MTILLYILYYDYILGTCTAMHYDDDDFHYLYVVHGRKANHIPILYTLCPV